MANNDAVSVSWSGGSLPLKTQESYTENTLELGESKVHSSGNKYLRVHGYKNLNRPPLLKGHRMFWVGMIRIKTIGLFFSNFQGGHRW
jgi:hypothetical protein